MSDYQKFGWKKEKETVRKNERKIKIQPTPKCYFSLMSETHFICFNL